MVTQETLDITHPSLWHTLSWDDDESTRIVFGTNVGKLPSLDPFLSNDLYMLFSSLYVCQMICMHPLLMESLTNEQFKKIFDTEEKVFKSLYTALHQQGEAWKKFCNSTWVNHPIQTQDFVKQFDIVSVALCKGKYEIVDINGLCVDEHSSLRAIVLSDHALPLLQWLSVYYPDMICQKMCKSLHNNDVPAALFLIDKFPNKDVLDYWIRVKALPILDAVVEIVNDNLYDHLLANAPAHCSNINRHRKTRSLKKHIAEEIKAQSPLKSGNFRRL